MLRPNRRVLPTRSLERARSGGLFPSMTGSRQAIPKSFCRSEVAMATLRTTKAGRCRPDPCTRSISRRPRGSPPGRPPPRRSRRRTSPPCPRRAREGRTPSLSGVTGGSADLDDVADHERPRLLAHAAEQVALRSASRWWTDEHRDRRGPRGRRGAGPRMRAEAHLIPAELARLEDHLRAGVEPGDLRRRDSAREPPGRLAGAEAELEDPPRRERDRRRSSPPGARRSGGRRPGSLHVGLGIEVELGAQPCRSGSPSVGNLDRGCQRDITASISRGSRLRSGEGRQARAGRRSGRARARRRALRRPGRHSPRAPRRLADRVRIRGPRALRRATWTGHACAAWRTPTSRSRSTPARWTSPGLPTRS